MDLLDSTQNALINTVSINTDTILAINENILFTINENDNSIITLSGITVVDKLKANSVETNSLTINDNIIAEDGEGEKINASSIGTATIMAEDIDIVVDTSALVEGSRVFVTPVSDMADNTFFVEKDFDSNLFKIIINHVVDNDVLFDWFIVSGTE